MKFQVIISLFWYLFLDFHLQNYVILNCCCILLFQVLFEQHTSEEREVTGQHELEGYFCQEEVWIRVQLNTRNSMYQIK